MNPFVSACLSCVLLYSYALYKILLSLNLSFSSLSTHYLRHSKGERKREWSKVPSHIAVLFPSDSLPSIDVVLDLITWCDQVDKVQILTLYDLPGNLLKLFPEVLTRMEERDFSRGCFKVNLVNPPPASTASTASTGIAGDISTKWLTKCCSDPPCHSQQPCQHQPEKLVINVISGDLGYPYFIRMINRQTNAKITMEDLFDKILSVEDITEPQLMLCLNEPADRAMTANQLTLDQFPPWLLRLTEFYKVPRPYWKVLLANPLLPFKFTHENFTQALDDYSGISQRFGK